MTELLTHTHTHTVSFWNVLSPTPAYSEGSGFGSVMHLLMLCCTYMSPPWRVPHPVSVCCFYLLFVHREFHLCEGLGSAIGNRVGFCSITIPQFIFLLVATLIVFLSKQRCCECPPWGLQAGVPWLLWINNWAQNCWLAHMPIFNLSGCLQIVLQSCLIWFIFLNFSAWRPFTRRKRRTFRHPSKKKGTYWWHWGKKKMSFHFCS